MDLSDFRVPSYGAVSDFRLETEQSPMDLTVDSPRKSDTVTQYTEVRRVHQIPYRLQILRGFRI